MSLVIRNFKPDQYQMVRDWANQQQWNEGKYDYLAFQLLDKNTFWIAELDGQPIASLSAAQYDENYAYLGLYICKPEFRGQGYGKKVWDKTLQHITAKNISLEAVLAQQKNYMKSGFKTYHSTLRYMFNGINQPYTSEYLVDCNKLEFEKLLSYDKKCFSAQRKQFLKKWITLPESKAIAFIKNDQIQGYGVLRVSDAGYRIGPLFAHSPQVAQQIIKSLAGSVTEDKKIFIDMPDINLEGLKIAQKWKMVNVFTCLRMFTNGPINVDFSKIVYGVTSIQFG